MWAEKNDEKDIKEFYKIRVKCHICGKEMRLGAVNKEYFGIFVRWDDCPHDGTYIYCKLVYKNGKLLFPVYFFEEVDELKEIKKAYSQEELDNIYANKVDDKPLE